MNPLSDTAPLYVVGPTGCGKSALALGIAEETGAEIVNADAFQVYRGMEILTAQPSAADHSRVPHHLYGFLDPAGDSDAARHAALARQAVSEIQSRGRRPLIVGGSGMYVKSLTHGLAELPGADPALRRQFEAMPAAEVAQWLCRLDPAAATAVNLQNPRHVQRALEISLLTGRPASEFKQAWKTSTPGIVGVFLNPSREELHRRINLRTLQMFRDGVIGEVERLGAVSRTAERAIGLREIRLLQSGNLTQSAVVESMQQATRQYAKRQVTWFKRETCFAAAPTAEAARTALAALHQHGCL